MKLLYGTTIGLTILLGFLLYAMIPKFNDCTIFTVRHNDTTIFGNNEDWHNGDLLIGIFPPTTEQYGRIMFGYEQDGVQSFQGGLNDQGLAWDLNSLPTKKINAHPEKPYKLYEDNMFFQLTTTISTVEDAIALFEQVDFGSSYGGQIHIADKSGDAVIISPGEDGEMAFTRITDDFLISTNFNHAIEGHGRQGWRYDTAYEMLSNYDNEPLQQYGMDILDSVSLNMLTTITVYSVSADLTNNTLQIAYISQFEDTITFSIEEAFETMNGTYDLKSFFPEDVQEAGDQLYQRFETRFKIAKITVIVLAVLIVSSITYSIIRVIRKRRKQESLSTTKKSFET